jgi:hypothetical protein
MKAEILVKAKGNEWSRIANKLKTKKEIKEVYLADGKYSLLAKYEGEETTLRFIKELLKECGAKGEIVVLHASMKRGKFRYFDSFPLRISSKK